MHLEPLSRQWFEKVGHDWLGWLNEAPIWAHPAQDCSRSRMTLSQGSTLTFAKLSAFWWLQLPFDLPVSFDALSYKEIDVFVLRYHERFFVMYWHLPF